MLFDVTLACMNRPWAQFSFERALEGVRAAGFSAFALLSHAREQLIAPDTPPEEAARVAEIIAQHGLRLVMIHHSVQLGGTGEAALESTKRQIDHCRRLGVRVLLEMGCARPEHYDLYFEIMRQAAPYAEDQGVVIALKPHGGLSTTGPDTLAAVRRVDHPAYRVCFDPGNLLYYAGERPEQSLPQLAPYVAAMCIKDETGGSGPGRTVTVTPGDGDVDFHEVFRILRDHAFAGPAAVETLGPGDRPEAVDEHGRRAYRFLTQQLAAL